MQAGDAALSLVRGMFQLVEITVLFVPWGLPTRVGGWRRWYIAPHAVKPWRRLNGNNTKSIVLLVDNVAECYTLAVMFVHEIAKFQYIVWDDRFKTEKPYQILSGLSENSPISKTNITFERSVHEETVTDIRENPTAYSLDTSGFSVHKIETEFADWFDREKVESQYLPQIVAPFLRKHVENATHIIAFDWHVSDYSWPSQQYPYKFQLRRNSKDAIGGRMDLSDSTQPLMPAKVVHVGKSGSLEYLHDQKLIGKDQTPAGVVRRVRQQLGDQADRAFQGRVRLIKYTHLPSIVYACFNKHGKFLETASIPRPRCTISCMRR